MMDPAIAALVALSVGGGGSMGTLRVGWLQGRSADDLATMRERVTLGALA